MKRSDEGLPVTTSSTSGTAAATAKEGCPEQQASDTREARVAELREQVLNGTYEVDAAKLSAKIVNRHMND